MSSVFDQLVSDGYNALVTTNGESVTYTPYNNGAAGTPVTFTAPFCELQGGAFERKDWEEKANRFALVECPTTVNNAPQSYVLDGTFSILGTLWKVDRLGPRDAASQTIYLKATRTDQKVARIP